MKNKTLLIISFMTCIQAFAQDRALEEFDSIPNFRHFEDSLVTLTYESQTRGSAFDTIYSCDFDDNHIIVAERHHGMLGIGSHDAQSYYKVFEKRITSSRDYYANSHSGELLLTAISNSQYHYTNGILDSITSTECDRKVALAFYIEQQEAIESNDTTIEHRMHPNKDEYRDTFECIYYSLERIVHDLNGRIVGKERWSINQTDARRTHSAFILEYDSIGRLARKTYSSPPEPRSSIETWKKGDLVSTYEYHDSIISVTTSYPHVLQLSDSIFDDNGRLSKVLTYQCDSNIVIKDSTSLFSKDLFNYDEQGLLISRTTSMLTSGEKYLVNFYRKEDE